MKQTEGLVLVTFSQSWRERHLEVNKQHAVNTNVLAAYPFTFQVGEGTFRIQWNNLRYVSYAPRPPCSILVRVDSSDSVCTDFEWRLREAQ